jgi:plasmid stabilization system protein ParE
MKVGYHPAVQRDVGGILRYDDEISKKLGDSFWDELIEKIETAKTNPERYHFDSAGRSLRRVNLEGFLHHFLYRIVPGKIRVVVVRHHHRHPSFGVTRR